MDADSAVQSQPSKWPFLGYTVPPYFALTGGIETATSHAWQAGIAISPTNVYSSGKAGFGGLRLYYKRDMNNKKFYSCEADLCVAGGLTFGFNYNYNNANGKVIHGFKPFIGLSFMHVQFSYGYCFYKDKLDTDYLLVHNRFTLNIDLPLFKIGK
jgi:hypothetical protein